MDEMIVFGWMALAIGAYAALMAVFARLVHPLRLTMASVGTELLERSDLQDKDREYVKTMLDEAFDWMVLVEACFLFPLLMLRYVRVQRMGDPAEDMLPPWCRSDVSEKTGHLARRVTTMHIVSVAAANPLCAIVLLLEVGIAAAFGLVFTRSFKAIYHVFQATIAKSDKMANAHLRTAQ